MPNRYYPNLLSPIPVLASSGDLWGQSLSVGAKKETRSRTFAVSPARRAVKL